MPRYIIQDAKRPAEIMDTLHEGGRGRNGVTGEVEFVKRGICSVGREIAVDVIVSFIAIRLVQYNSILLE